MPRALVVPAGGASLEMIERPHLSPAAGEVVIAVRAAGVCHSDEHFRNGHSASMSPPRVLGHEIAGEIIAVGEGVTAERIGQRVAVHYVVSCGTCAHCGRGREQFCAAGAMIGLQRDGGFAEQVAVPAVNAVPLPDQVPFAEGAILMCAGATAFHALERARLAAGETVAILGIGGIGMLGVQLAHARGAARVFAVDRDPSKLAAAARVGAVPVDASTGDAVAEVRRSTDGAGVDVAVESIGLSATIRQAIDMSGVHGRVVVVGLTRDPVPIDSYKDLLGRETSLMGSNDHLLDELPQLLDLAAQGKVALDDGMMRRVPFTAEAVNGALADLRAYRAPVRTVIEF